MSEFKPVGRFIEPGPRYRGVERIAQIRSYSEYSEASVADSNGYWLEGEKVFSQSQVFEMLAAAPAPPRPIYDEAKERELFEAHYRDLFETETGRSLSDDDIKSLRDGPLYGKSRTYLNGQWVGWQACAQSRAKAGEDE